MNSVRKHMCLLVMAAVCLVRPSSAFLTPKCSGVASYSVVLGKRTPAGPLFTSSRSHQFHDSPVLPASDQNPIKKGSQVVVKYVMKKLGWWSSVIGPLRRAFRSRVAQRIRKFGIASVLFLAVLWMNMLTAGAAVTGGRMGGSFRSSGSGGGGGGFYGGRSTHHGTPHLYHHRPYYYTPSTQLHYRNYPEAEYAVNRASEGTFESIVVGAATVVAVPHVLHHGLHRAFPPTARVLTLTIGLKIRDREAPDSVMSQMRKIADSCDTSSLAGVLDMLKQTAETLKQHQPLITSAALSQSEQMSEVEGEREFHRRSTQERTKLDLEAINKYGALVAMEADVTLADTISEAADKDDGSTVAVVAITVSYDGYYDLPSEQLLNREDLRGLLTTISAIQKEALIAGEVIWAPATSKEYVPQDYLYRNYPNLVPL